jgi:molecular chaperone IbpA
VNINRELWAFHRLLNPNQYNYPPHNIAKTSSGYLLELAVSGFNRADLSVELESNNLKISGTHPQDEDGLPVVTYLHHGISQKPFVREFSLTPGMEVEEVSLVNGILAVSLTEPKAAKSKSLKIG